MPIKEKPTMLTKKLRRNEVIASSTIFNGFNEVSTVEFVEIECIVVGVDYEFGRMVADLNREKVSGSS